MAGAIFFFVYDLTVDAFFEGEFGSPHFIIESLIFIGVSWALLTGWRDLIRVIERLEREQERNKALSGALAEGISSQMDEWGMTRSEKDIGWLLIKGFSFAEISRLRKVKEHTTRLQASSLYAKSGVSGRAEFCAEIIQAFLLSIPDEYSSSDMRPQNRDKTS